MTNIESNFSVGSYQNTLKSANKDKVKIRLLYQLFKSLSEETKIEIDGLVYQVQKDIPKLGFLSAFELVMKALMYKADSKMAKETFTEIAYFAEMYHEEHKCQINKQ